MFGCVHVKTKGNLFRKLCDPFLVPLKHNIQGCFLLILQLKFQPSLQLQEPKSMKNLCDTPRKWLCNLFQFFLHLSLLVHDFFAFFPRLAFLTGRWAATVHVMSSLPLYWQLNYFFSVTYFNTMIYFLFTIIYYSDNRPGARKAFLDCNSRNIIACPLSIISWGPSIQFRWFN